MRADREWFRWILIMIFVPIVCYLLVSFCGYTVRFVDINNGSEYVQNFVFDLPITRGYTLPNEFSIMIDKIDKVDPDWRPANSTGLGFLGINQWRCGNALGAVPSLCDEFLTLLDSNKINQEARQNLINEFLAALRKSNINRLKEINQEIIETRNLKKR